MAFTDFVSSFFTPSTVYAEEQVAAPATEESQDTSNTKEEESKEEESASAASTEEESPAEEEAPAAEEEEEEEPEDILPGLRESCGQSKECSGFNKHFEHCTEKITAGGGYKGEDCVEELLMHCVDNCVGPKLFSKLK